MLLERDRKVFYYISLISLVLSLIVAIPFGLGTVSKAEVIIKYIVCPVVIVIITISGISLKYRSYRPAVKFTTAATYTPFCAYLVAILLNTIFILMRSNEVLDVNAYFAYIIGFTVLGVVLAILSQLYVKLVLYFSKNEAMIIDAFALTIAVCLIVTCAKIAFEYATSSCVMEAKAYLVIFPVILLACLFAYQALNVTTYYKTKEEFVLIKRDAVLENVKLDACFEQKENTVVEEKKENTAA